MHELLEEFCTRFYDWNPEDRAAFSQNILQRLEKIDQCLQLVNSRFIDLDPSAKIQNEAEFIDFKNYLRIFSNHSPKLVQDLVLLFEAFSLYLLMRDRFGEAAEWYLKNDYDDRLKNIIQESLPELTQKDKL